MADGGGVGETTAKEQGGDGLSSPSQYIELLEGNCKYFMLCGMTYDEYWHGDVCMGKYFVEAYELAKEREYEEFNYKAWIQGLYFMRAVSTTNEHLEKSIGSMLSGKKSKKMINEYPNKPIEFTKEEQNLTEEERALKEIAQWQAFLLG